MTRGKGRGPNRSAKTVRVELAAEDVRTLLELAGYYEKSMGPMRFIVRFTTAPEMRRRFDFLAEESKWLRLFVEDGQEKHFSHGEQRGHLDFTPTALVAFWGRLLASLNSRRSRRRLSDSEARHRETLAATLGEVAQRLAEDDPQTLKAALATRRSVEQEWMRERLEGQKVQPPLNPDA
jgi:hypothetical protein